jgi:hypothetical protein
MGSAQTLQVPSPEIAVQNCSANAHARLHSLFGITRVMLEQGVNKAAVSGQFPGKIVDTPNLRFNKEFCYC